MIEDIAFWSDTHIVAKTPAANTEGTVYVVRRVPLFPFASNVVAYVVQAVGLPSQPYGYEAPVRENSLWPLFRHDERNTGSTPLPAVYQGDRPWSFRTGKGIFSTPVIDEHGVIYVGSADHNFYALSPDGAERFRFPTGEIIDSAGALPRLDPAIGYPTVLIPSGDGHIYNIRTDNAVTGTDRLLWAFDARSAPGTGFNYDGTILAGNTNFNYYALHPDGTLKWTYPTGSNNWSIAGLGDNGMIYWGSNDLYVRGVQPNGAEQWRLPRRFARRATPRSTALTKSLIVMLSDTCTAQNRLRCSAGERSISYVGVETLRYAHAVSQPAAGRRARRGDTLPGTAAQLARFVNGLCENPAPR